MELSIRSDISSEIPGEYELEQIDAGAFGEVYWVKDRANPTEKRFVVKIVNVSDARRDRDENYRELEILKRLDHPRIVPFYGYDLTQFKLKLFMGYMSLGSLSSCIRRLGSFQEARAKHFTVQILEGVSYLHTYVPAIIHRDIKGDNILLEDENNLRLTDFGVSKVLTELTNARTDTGTFNFRAPETFQPNTEYGVKADIWSVGCTVVEMLTGKPPYNTVSKTFDLIRLMEREKPDHNLTEGSPEMKQFLESCFQLEPNERPSADELLQTIQIV